MIYGIGTDICDIRRIKASLERHGERFAAKVLSDAEMATWKARSARWPERGVRYLAIRFSAKEAFSKAIGLGMRMPMTWRLCEVGKLPSAVPLQTGFDAADVADVGADAVNHFFRQAKYACTVAA
jgi:holo-[acyl-carrier protein] synthase